MHNLRAGAMSRAMSTTLRTSDTHPLQIATIPSGGGKGQIGLTFCPGKKQPHAMTGGWDRSLGVDLDAVEQWGAAALISLIEPHELTSLGVPTLGDEVAARSMTWLHLPIADVSTPGPDFEASWAEHGDGIRARLRDGFNVLVHCKGGLGRAGMIAAKLMVELGLNPEDAVRNVRAARPGAIETPSQHSYVLAQRVAPEQEPARSADAIRDRALGALIGLAVGDAVGTTLEFKARDSDQPLTDMIGGGPFNMKAGEWTDDTSMALALADSLIADRNLDPADLMERFWAWRERGEYSCGCNDIGITVSGSLSRWRRTGDAFAGSTDPNSAGNGSLMRLSPVALAHWNDRAMLADVAARQSRTTHGAPEAVSACVGYADILADAIAGMPRSGVMAPRQGEFAGKVADIMAGSWRGLRRNQIQSSGYVAHSLEAALWAVGRTADFRSAVLLAANLGGDADTTAAIAGQLAGALYGLRGIPKTWLEKLAWRDRILDMGERLVAPTLN